MTLQEQLSEDLKSALRSGDKIKVSVVRLLKSAIRNTEIAKGATLDDPGVLAVVSKEARQRRESIEAFQKANRLDLARQEEAELKILLSYLPEQVSREEISRVAKQVISEVNAQGPSDMGKVMPKLMEQLRGRAEGREVSAVVAELLGGSFPGRTGTEP